MILYDFSSFKLSKEGSSSIVLKVTVEIKFSWNRLSKPSVKSESIGSNLELDLVLNP